MITDQVVCLPVKTIGHSAPGGCDDCNATKTLFRNKATVITAVTHSDTCPTLIPRRHR